MAEWRCALKGGEIQEEPCCAGDQCDEKKINDELVPSQGSSTSTAQYQFVDKDCENGTKYFYMVEAVKNPVRTRKYGPASATPRLIWGILPQ